MWRYCSGKTFGVAQLHFNKKSLICTGMNPLNFVSLQIVCILVVSHGDRTTHHLLHLNRRTYESCNMATNGEFKVSFMSCLIDSMTTSYKVWGVCLSKMVQLKVRCFVLSASLDCKSVAALLPDRGDRNVNQLWSSCNKSQKQPNTSCFNAISSNPSINGS